MAKVNLDKFKDLGIRHGEKVGVAVVSALCLLMFWMAWSHPTIDLAPDEIEKVTSSAQSNLSRSQDEEAILTKIEEQGITLPGFEKVVDARVPGAADPSKYSLANLMVSPEPGAGLLRDRPELITVAQLQVHTGRGAITIFDVDPQTGDVVYVDPDADDETKKSSERRKKRNRSRGMAGMMGMMGMGGGQKEDAKTKAETEKAKKRQQEILRRGLGGTLPPDAGTPEEETSARADGKVPKEVLRGFRWVALTAVLEHKRLRENYAKALKVDLAAANPHYLRVDVERQERGRDGSWSDWQPVDREWIESQVLNRLTETDPETNPATNLALLKENVTLEALTDRLPFLEVGYWTGIYPVELVNAKAFEPPKEKETTGAGGAMMGGMPMPGMMRGEGMMGAGGMAPGMGMPGMGMPGMPMPGMEGAFGGMFGSSVGAVDTNFEKTEADKVLVRYLDFTVGPDAIYRYRARIVVQNPNWKVQSVMAGVDTESKELFGPWSEPSETVVVPPDVAAYVVDYAPAAMDKQRDDLVSFEMVRWEPESGLTIAKSQFAAPGQIIGGQDYSDVPDLEKSETHRARVDFTSYRVLVDTLGGPRPINQLKVGSNRYDAPAIALMLRPDGTLVLRDEAGDATDGEMEEMKEIYAQTLKDAKPEDKQSSTLMGTGMAMPGM